MVYSFYSLDVTDVLSGADKDAVNRDLIFRRTRKSIGNLHLIDSLQIITRVHREGRLHQSK